MSHTRRSIISAMSSSLGERGVLDRAHALLHGQPQPGAAVGVRGGVGAGPIGLLDGGADLLARVGARGRHGARRADAARHEDLHVVGAAAQVLARAAADLVHAVVADQRSAVAVVGGQAAAGHQQARPGDDAGLDGVAHVDVDEVLLAHDPHRRRAGGQILAEIPRGGQGLRHRPPAELAELIAEPGDDRGVRVAIDEARHDEAMAQIERAGAGRRRRGVGAPTAVMRPSSTMIPASRRGAAPVPSNSVPHRIARTVTSASVRHGDPVVAPRRLRRDVALVNVAAHRLGIALGRRAPARHRRPS